MKVEMVLRGRKRGEKEREEGKKKKPTNLYQVVWNLGTVLLSKAAVESNPEHNWLQMKHFNIKSWVVPWSCSSGLHELHVSGGKICLFFSFFLFPFAKVHSVSICWKFLAQSNCSSAYNAKIFCLEMSCTLKNNHIEINKEKTQFNNNTNKQIPNKIRLTMPACHSVFCCVKMFIKLIVILYNDILFVLSIFQKTQKVK